MVVSSVVVSSVVVSSVVVSSVVVSAAALAGMRWPLLGRRAIDRALAAGGLAHPRSGSSSARAVRHLRGGFE